MSLNERSVVEQKSLKTLNPRSPRWKDAGGPSSDEERSPAFVHAPQLSQRIPNLAT